MSGSISVRYGIDPNRVPTEAEAELVAYCFGVSILEARAILGTRKRNAPDFAISLTGIVGTDPEGIVGTDPESCAHRRLIQLSDREKA